MKNIKFKFLLILFIFFTISCEKIFLGKDIDDTPENNFNYLWQKIEMGYSFFDVKKVDWDSVYYKYSPRITDEMNDEELFDQLAEMMNELKDGHVNLYSPFKTSKYDISMLGPVNIDFRLIKDNYLTTGNELTGPFTHGFIRNHNIGYIRYPSFNNSLTSAHFEYMLAKYKDTEGLVFDIRQNGGGQIDNVFFILSRFTDKKVIVYYSVIKTGYIGIDDSTFSEPEAKVIEPSNGIKYPKPVIVLTDRGSYSASSFFAVSCMAMPNMILMGDTTGGGLGLPRGGQLPNGWIYRFPVTRTYSIDGKNWENGVPPDIYITLSPDHNITGTDNILEAAIDKILN